MGKRTDNYEKFVLETPSDNLETVNDQMDEADISISDGDAASDDQIFEIDYIPEDDFGAPLPGSEFVF